ncbi:MAG: M56 family metallopeptidase [Pseudoxanthomonas sp.]
MTAELLSALLETTLATSAAVLLVLCLRKPLMAKLGAGAAYASWALVPVAALAVLLPAPSVQAVRMTALPAALRVQQATPLQLETQFPWQAWLLGAWLLGVVVTALLFWMQQRRFQHSLRGSMLRGDGLQQARGTQGLPAVVGVWRPRIVLPADFDSRYGADERELILCHERIHIARRDLQANALVAALRALHWFNPLLHIAAARFRRDQELACDARVIARHPQQRRSYADAMLKTQMTDSSLPLGCHWQDSRPLKERITMLKQHSAKTKHARIGLALVAGLALVTGYAAWAAQPEQVRVDTQTAAYYSVKLRLDVDGESRDFEVREYAGKPFAFSTKTQAGHEWIAEFKVDGLDADKAVLSGTLSENGKKISEPTLVVKLGNTATIQVNTPDVDSMFMLDAVVTRAEAGQSLPADAVSVASVDIASKNTNPPAYPADAEKNRVTGKVLVVVDVGADGSVTGMKIEKAEPAYENGKPVAGRVRVPISFDMDEPDNEVAG